MSKYIIPIVIVLAICYTFFVLKPQKDQFVHSWNTESPCKAVSTALGTMWSYKVLAFVKISGLNEAKFYECLVKHETGKWKEEFVAKLSKGNVNGAVKSALEKTSPKNILVVVNKHFPKFNKVAIDCLYQNNIQSNEIEKIIKEESIQMEVEELRYKEDNYKCR